MIIFFKYFLKNVDKTNCLQDFLQNEDGFKTIINCFANITKITEEAANQNELQNILNNPEELQKILYQQEFIVDTEGNSISENISLSDVRDSLELDDGTYVINKKNKTSFENSKAFLQNIGFPVSEMQLFDLISYASVLNFLQQDSEVVNNFAANIYQNVYAELKEILSEEQFNFIQKLSKNYLQEGILCTHFKSLWYVKLPSLLHLLNQLNAQKYAYLNESRREAIQNQFITEINTIINPLMDQANKENNPYDFKFKILTNLKDKIDNMKLDNIDTFINVFKKVNFGEQFSKKLNELTEQLDVLNKKFGRKRHFEIVKQIHQQLTQVYDQFCEDGDYTKFKEAGAQVFQDVSGKDSSIDIHTNGFYQFLHDVGLLSLVKWIMSCFKPRAEVEQIFHTPVKKVSQFFNHEEAIIPNKEVYDDKGEWLNSHK